MTKVITPDLKAGAGALIYVDLAPKTATTVALGGSALAQALGKLGEAAPESDVGATARCFDAVQSLIDAGAIAAGHDRSDGGLVTCLLEMAFAGGCAGLDVNVPSKSREVEGGAAAWVGALFGEAPGLVVQCAAGREGDVSRAFEAADVSAVAIGRATSNADAVIRVDGVEVLRAPVRELWADWEATAFAMERHQGRDHACVALEAATLATRTPPSYHAPPTARAAPEFPRSPTDREKRKVAIVRCEGSNGDREMCAAFHLAGCEPWDVAVADLASGAVDLDRRRGRAAFAFLSFDVRCCKNDRRWTLVSLRVLVSGISARRRPRRRRDSRLRAELSTRQPRRRLHTEYPRGSRAGSAASRSSAGSPSPTCSTRPRAGPAPSASTKRSGRSSSASRRAKTRSLTRAGEPELRDARS